MGGMRDADAKHAFYGRTLLSLDAAGFVKPGSNDHSW